MGFFSSQKGRVETYIGDQTPVKIIRSRFYGKGKERDREDVTGAGRIDIPRSSMNGHVKGNNFTTEVKSRPRIAMNQTMSTKPGSIHNGTALKPQSVTDQATLTLTQRLNELAAANAEGLLDDDEYRILRRSLFERFAGDTAVPSEKPIVPSSIPCDTLNGRPSLVSQERSYMKASNHLRSPSLRSKSSVTSVMSSLFRWPGRRRSAILVTDNDTSSVFSISSSASNAVYQPQPRTTVSTLLHADSPRTPFDAASFNSRHTRLEVDTGYAEQGSPSRKPARSGGRSIGQRMTPPSSFPNRVGAHDEPKHAPAYTSIVVDPSDEDLTSANDIRRQISILEAESLTVMDAFNGLELSALTRYEPSQLDQLGSQSYSYLDASFSSTMSPRRKRSRIMSDTDNTSLFSFDSASPSTASSRVTRRSRPIPRTPSHGQSLRRQASMSSMDSGEKSKTNTQPLALPQPLVVGRMGSASSSSVNLTKPNSGHPALAPVSENEHAVVSQENPDLLEVEQELTVIRQRRVEMTRRYDARLNYLRAKLKGAELREKLK